MTDKEFNKALGASIRVARKRLGYSQTDMARMLNIKQPTYSTIESGARNTTVFKVAIIINTLGIVLPEVQGIPLVAIEHLESKEPWPERNNI